MILGLTGKYCSGKSTVSRILEERGCKTIDVDTLGHEALEKKQDTLIKVFGREILKDGKIDRKALGVRVFSDSHRRMLLEGIVHPFMVRRVKDLIQQYSAGGNNCIVLNAALLHYMGIDELCDDVLFVQTSFLRRFRRARKRDRAPVSMFLRRMSAQKHIHPNLISSRGDVYIIENNNSLRRINNQLDEFFSVVKE
ncbi:MAG: dephospho-CoA kinase [Spirochaetia bacterium]|nr:dephospho-CoA kinase [Spirochaetia bacterium]